MKKKVFLASAILATSVVLSSCGGGGSGTTTSTTPAPSTPPPTNTPTALATALVLTTGGLTSQGLLYGLYEATIQSDGTVKWSSDLNPNGNVEFTPVHELADNAVILSDNNGNLYLYKNGTLANLGVQGNINQYVTKFAIGNNFIITNQGKVIDQKDNNGNRLSLNLVYAGTDYVVYSYNNNGNRVVIAKADGTKTEIANLGNATPIILDRYNTEDTILLGHNGVNAPLPVFIIDSTGKSTKVDDVKALRDNNNNSLGKFVKGSDGNYYVALGDNGANTNNLRYYKVTSSGSTLVRTDTNTNLNAGSFALDGNGTLYMQADCDNDNANELAQITINGALLCKEVPVGGNYQLLPFSKGVIVLTSDNNNNNYYYYTTSDTTTVTQLSPASGTQAALSTCLQAYANIKGQTVLYTKTIQETVVGKGTDRIMCANQVNVNQADFAWVSVNSASSTPSYDGRKIENVSNTYSIAGSNFMIFRTNNNNANNDYFRCTYGTTSCYKYPISFDRESAIKREQGIWVVDNNRSIDNIRAVYNMNNALSFVDLSSQTRPTDFGLLFTDNNNPPTGGNVSFDLTKAVATYRPAAGATCRQDSKDGLWYKPINGQDVKIDKSGKCIIRVLQVR